MAGARSASIGMALASWVISLMGGAAAAPQTLPKNAAVHAPGTFLPAEECMACHNGLTTPHGEDVSIGIAWRASMMANSARDPYWQASVRRETLDHPLRAADIRQECAICHRPTGQQADGVSCTVCHQIAPDRLGTRDSFVGRFVVAPPSPEGVRRMFGPFTIERGRASVMRSATGVVPTESMHIRQSEVCATCHTLITQAFGPNGEVIGSIPEQVPYLEWRHSAYVEEERGCQSCHMPSVAEATRIASVLGEAREDLSRHTFLGGNFFMLRMLNRHRGELGVVALARELDASADGTVRQLQSETATVAIERVAASARGLEIAVAVRNIAGHKFPTGYPSRRAWLHLVVRDSGGRVVFESGMPRATGAIAGNDNDDDASRVEPHYLEITSQQEVQIYESVMADRNGMPTTGLLQATSFIKDNRLLPRGFDKASASADVAVHGAAAHDDDFADGGDRVRYVIDTRGATGPYEVSVELWYQPIGFRWAQNLATYDAPEPKRFLKYYQTMAAESGVLVAATRN